jgi:spore germination protein YaaH
VSLTYYFLSLPNNKVVQAFDKNKLNLVIGGEIINETPRIMEDQILLSIDTIKKYFDPNIYWDKALKKVTITTKNRVIRMKTDSLNAKVNDKDVTLKIPVTVENNIVLIPIEFLSDFYKININYNKAGSVVIIDYKTSIKQIATPITKGAVVRKGRSIHNPIIKKMDILSVKPEEIQLRIFGENNGWYKVRTIDGSVGFIQKKFVVVKKVVVKENSQPEEETNIIWKPAIGKINLVWQMMYEPIKKLSRIKKVDGLDVVSPTWFQLENSTGELINRSESSYVVWAHKNGYKVWALLSNDFTDPVMTGKFLNNTDSRDRLIRYILMYASLYNLDGINIDFENINLEDKAALTQFVREITPFLKLQGLVVSIDVGIPDGSDNFSKCYDRVAIGKVVDYVMLMAYDQHWRTSPEAGSVAQISWVEDNLAKTLNSIPKEKLLLGLPFYTRLWKEETDNTGKIKVSNPEVLSMEDVKKIISDNKASVIWDNESGQFYTEFKKDNSLFKIWIEDGNSIDLKSSLIQKYKLAGAASWRKSDESPEIWRVLNKNLKQLDYYQEWVDQNVDKKYILNLN